MDVADERGLASSLDPSAPDGTVSEIRIPTIPVDDACSPSWPWPACSGWGSLSRSATPTTTPKPHDVRVAVAATRDRVAG
jgi:hypothetical protein